jgi:hypothetical protein
VAEDEARRKERKKRMRAVLTKTVDDVERAVVDSSRELGIPHVGTAFATLYESVTSVYKVWIWAITEFAESRCDGPPARLRFAAMDKPGYAPGDDMDTRRRKYGEWLKVHHPSFYAAQKRDALRLPPGMIVRHDMMKSSSIPLILAVAAKDLPVKALLERIQLIYRPDPGSARGERVIPITILGRGCASDLDAPYDLTACGDTAKHLDIWRGLRTRKLPENENKLEVWLTPRFLVEYNLDLYASHYRPIMGSSTAPIGLFMNWGGWDNLNFYDYLTTDDGIDSLTSRNLCDLYAIVNKEFTGGAGTTGPGGLRRPGASAGKLVSQEALKHFSFRI